MKNVLVVLLCLFLAGISLALQACTTLMTIPWTTVFGGAQLAIKGAELQKEIRKADVQEAFDSPFEKTWNMSVNALKNLRIEITRTERNQEGDGGLIEARAQKIKVRIAAAKLMDNITEIGIWAEHDKALARLIAQKIKEEEQKSPSRGLGSGMIMFGQGPFWEDFEFIKLFRNPFNLSISSGEGLTNFTPNR